MIAVTIFGDLRQHKLLAVRAVGTGLLTILAATALKYRITSESWANGLVAFWSLTWLSFLLAGWVVGATHRRHRLPMLVAFTAYAAFAKGWLYVSTSTITGMWRTRYALYWTSPLPVPDFV